MSASRATTVAPSLFDVQPDEVTANRPGPTRHGQPDTATHAAHTVKTGTQRANALRALVMAGTNGLTDYELAQAIRHPRPHVAGTRRKELADLGLVEATAARRLTDTGNPAVVWQVTAEGVRLFNRLVA